MFLKLASPSFSCTRISAVETGTQIEKKLQDNAVLPFLLGSSSPLPIVSVSIRVSMSVGILSGSVHYLELPRLLLLYYVELPLSTRRSAATPSGHLEKLKKKSIAQKFCSSKRSDL